VQGSLECNVCPPGFIAAQTGTTTCSACPAGEVRCGWLGTVGGWAASGASVCLLQERQEEAPAPFDPAHKAHTSPPPHPTPPHLSSPQITIAEEGKGASACTKCAIGTWKPEDATDNKCRSCPAGMETKLNAEGASSCTPCEAGYFATQPNTPLCSMCEPGSFAANKGEWVGGWVLLCVS